jgi:hypothetical protein
MIRAPCTRVRVVVRRVSRHPITQRTLRSGNLLRKHVIRGATLGLVPDAVNDVAFHHAKMNLDEVIHVFQDTATISTMTAVLAALMVVTNQRE